MNNNFRNSSCLIPFEEFKENRDLVFNISEGNIHLYSILNFCIDNNIPTVACCAGHQSHDLPYITFIYNKNTRFRINSFLNKISFIKNVEVMFSSSGKDYNDFSVTVYTKMYNRDLVFSIIDDCLKSGFMDEYLNDDLSVCLNFAVNINYNLEFSFVSHYNVYIFNKFLRSRYMVGLYNNNVAVKYLDSQNDGKREFFGRKYYLYRTKKKFEITNSELQKMYPFFWIGNKSLRFGVPSNDDVNIKVDNLQDFCNQIEQAEISNNQRKRQG